MALDKATIVNLDTGEAIPVLFNPEEYTLDFGNTIAEIGIPGVQKSPVQYVRGNVRTLRMELFFDTYEQNEDVRKHTSRITALLEPVPTTLAPPGASVLLEQPAVPVRAGIGLAALHHVPAERHAGACPAHRRLQGIRRLEVTIEKGVFVGPPTVRNLVEGETLSKLAHEYLGDPGAWRDIAEANGIDDPINLRPGMQIVIPSDRTRRGI